MKLKQEQKIDWSVAIGRLASCILNAHIYDVYKYVCVVFYYGTYTTVCK